MSQDNISDNDILAYLDETLAVSRMTVVEAVLRDSAPLRRRAAALLRRRDDGFHSIGDIWRRHRVSCPTRRQLGSYLLDALDGPHKEYVDFHIQTTGCRYCVANLKDLEESMAQSADVEQRRRKFFQSSAGHVRKLSGE